MMKYFRIDKMQYLHCKYSCHASHRNHHTKERAILTYILYCSSSRHRRRQIEVCCAEAMTEVINLHDALWSAFQVKINSTKFENIIIRALRTT